MKAEEVIWMFGVIIIAILAALGALCFFAPGLAVNADKRDDPESIAQIKKAGLMIIVFAIGAGLLMMKYRFT